MSNDLAISVSSVSKMYRIFDRPEDRLKDGILWRFGKRYGREFWALKDISFDVKKGESVGIIGRNGSGKSTLLQIIAGTLQPTSGSVQVNGRVAALLELGSGFNPDYTGRENVYMNAAILGLTKEETDAKFDDIASFADIGQFIEQPVTTYSSGMMVRLAFAVQTAVKPDMLIVDEALSVGDEAFQRKCFSRLKLLQEAGTTLLFVSHSAQQVVQLCNLAILLNEGAAIATGTPKHVVALYHRLLYGAYIPTEQLKAEHATLETATNERPPSKDSTGDSSGIAEPGTDTSYMSTSLVSQSLIEYPSKTVRIHDVRIENQAGQRVNHLTYGHTYNYRYQVDVTSIAFRVSFHCLIKTTSGFELSGYMTHPQQEGIDVVQPGSSFLVTFPFTANLTPGTYFFNAGICGLVGEKHEYLHRLVDVLAFRVQPFVQIKFTSHVNLFGEAVYTATEGQPGI